MDPFTLALLGTGIAKAGAGIAQGVGTARAGKKMQLSDAEAAELADLERRRASGDLGLTERQRGALEQRFLTEQSGVTRQIEAQGIQQAAARGGGASGRELFLAEQAQAGALRGTRQQQNIAVEQLNQQQAQADAARMEALSAQRKQAEAMRAQGIAQAVTGGLAGAAEVAATGLAQAQQVKMQQIDAAARAEETQSLINRYNAPGSTGGYGFGAFSGAQRGGF